MHGHALQAALRALGLMFAAALVVVVVVAWTLARGPVAVPMLRPVIERALDRVLATADLPLAAKVDGVVLTWRAEEATAGGVSAGLEVDLLDTRLTDGDGRVVANLGTVAVDLDPAALVLGRVELAALTLVGPTLNLERAPNGRVALDVAGFGGGARATPTAPAAPADPDAVRAEALETWALLADMGFAVRDARLSLTDRVEDRVWSLDADRLRLRRQGEALMVEGSLSLTGADAAAPTATIDVALRHQPGEDLASLILILRDLEPARHLARYPGLAALGGWDQPLSGTLAIDLDLAVLATLAAGRGDAVSPGAPLRFARLVLSGGAGWARLPPPVDRAYAVRALDLEATLSAGARALEVSRLTVGLDGATVAATARAEGIVEGPPRLAVNLALSPMGVPELLTLWPSGVAHGAWSWIADNLSGGDPGRGETGRGETGRGETGSGDGARSGLAGSRFSVDLAGPDWASIAVTDLSGEATAAGLTVRYLGELPVATDASGRLRFSLDAITIDGLRGRVGALAVREGRITFTDFDAPVERAAMTFQIEGPLSSALALIDHQPLGYASQVGLDPARAAGDVDTTLTVALPLLKDVALEDVAIGVAAEATGVGLPDVALGQDLTDGDLSLTLDNAGLDVTGRARLGGVAASLDWRENFTAGAAFDRRYVVRGRADTAARARFGLDGPPFAPPWLDGPVDVDLTYTEIAGQPGVLQARVDLTPATMAMPDLDWVKPAGEEGTVSIEGRFGDHAMTVGFDLFAVPGQATVTGEARLDGAGERLRGLTLSRVRLGRTEARAEIVAPASAGAPWRVGLTGAALDATVLLSDDDAEEAGAGTSGGGPAAPVVTAQGDAEDEAPGPPLDVSLDVERLLLSDNITLHAARVGLTRDGAGVWRKARVDGRIQGGPPVSLRLDPGADGLRRFTLTADDAGAVARALDITRSLRGGRMTLTGTLDEAGVARGRLEAANVFLTKVPVLVRLLAVASLTGILEELQGEGLSLSTLVVPFTYADPRLTLNAARANGPSLGLTANGTLDLDAETMDLEGVVVPAYLVNSLLGRIPVVGNLLVGEKGGGVFAVDYSAEGPMDDPRIAVNPLTLLTPGILREVFGVIPDGVDEGGVDEGGVEEDEAQPPRSFERGLD